MTEEYVGKNRREFVRFKHSADLKYKVYSVEAPLATGITKDISSSGILFRTKEPLPIGQTVWLGVDYKNLEICCEIESRAAVVDNGLIGKVVRIEEDTNGEYDIGLCFLLKEA